MRPHHGRAASGESVITHRTFLIALLLVGSPRPAAHRRSSPTHSPIRTPTLSRRTCACNDASCAAGAYVGVGSAEFDDVLDEARSFELEMTLR